MKTDIKQIFYLKHFFNIVQVTDSSIKYTLRKPSQMLIKNIQLNWLQYIYTKTHKDMPVYINGFVKNLNEKTSLFGYIDQKILNYNDQRVLEHCITDSIPENKTELQLELFIPQQDAMQYFIKWQRYRKYWWSSISTTPSLFRVNDIKYEDKTASVDIIAQSPTGGHPVENLAIKFGENNKLSQLTCCLSLRDALNILLLDGLNNKTKEEYLRLHRKIAPYKIAFALDIKETEKKETFIELTRLLYHKLKSNNISTWLPEFTLPYDLQIPENLRLGVTYTAILNENTLNDGIFRLMNSSTMLGEQVHVADFHKYAAILFEK